MNLRRGDVWLADLDPVRGSEQAGKRPVIVIQNDQITRGTRTVLAIPLTSNVDRATLPSAVLIQKDEGGLQQDSIALCHQMKVLDKTRLTRRIGRLTTETLNEIESRVLYTLGID